MKTRTIKLCVQSTEAPEFIDITDQLHRCVEGSGVQNGFVVVFSKHTTAAIKINENEPLLLKDMARFLERIASRNGYYQHNDFSVRTVNMTEGECPNGHAHCQHLMLGASETIPIVEGLLHLGRWQKVFLVELDRPREREVILQIVGE
ncbi:MAG: YjbQ family protein [Chloroflexi bacterium]|nr:YjbQ family protein [Chloroflexota bacterium]